jgi:hypothetical protein
MPSTFGSSDEWRHVGRDQQRAWQWECLRLRSVHTSDLFPHSCSALPRSFSKTPLDAQPPPPTTVATLILARCPSPALWSPHASVLRYSSSLPRHSARQSWRISLRWPPTTRTSSSTARMRRPCSWHGLVEGSLSRYRISLLERTAMA